jgi:hypothetical protein
MAPFDCTDLGQGRDRWWPGDAVGFSRRVVFLIEPHLSIVARIRPCMGIWNTNHIYGLTWDSFSTYNLIWDYTQMWTDISDTISIRGHIRDTFPICDLRHYPHKWPDTISGCVWQCLTSHGDSVSYMEIVSYIRPRILSGHIRRQCLLSHHIHFN